jgi:type VII secretion protein EssB
MSVKHTNSTISEVVKKSSMVANDKYDRHKLEVAGEHFLAFEYEETAEEITFTYDVKNAVAFANIHQEDMVTKLNILMQVAKLIRDTKAYIFSILPDNLYYNSNGSVYIKSRDVIGSEKVIGTTDFINSYKALIGCVLNRQYTFRDYIEGGNELLKKSKLTNAILPLDNEDSIVEYLEDTKRNYIDKQTKTKVYISKSGSRFLKIACIVLLILTILLGTYGGIEYFNKMPYLTAVNNADNAYIENNNVAVIDSLQEIDIANLDKHQKYILARAYLSSENLTNEQKENILSKLTLASNEKELEYWCYVGKSDVGEAENIAMQLSNNELLLYAYMKDKAYTESDISISGEEKAQKLEEIQAKINNLSKELTDEVEGQEESKAEVTGANVETQKAEEEE